MKNKIEAVILMVSFVSIANVYPSVVVGMVVQTVYLNSTVSLWATLAFYFGTYPVACFVFLRLAQMVLDLENVGEWVTVEKVGGDGKKTKRRIRVYKNATRDHERENEVNR